MDKTALVEKTIHEGKEIVENLDKSGLFFPIAMWLLLPNKDEWRLILGKEGVEQNGPRDYYKKIQRLLGKMNPRPNVTLNDISVIGMESDLAKVMKAAFRTGKSLSGIRFTGNVVKGRLIDDAYVYRVV